MRHVGLLLATLLALAAPAAAETFTVLTTPPGARVILVGPPDRILGLSGQPLELQPRGDLVHLRIELDGYQPHDLMLPTSSLTARRAPVELQRATHFPWGAIGGLAVVAVLALAWVWRKPAPAPAVDMDRSGRRLGPYLLLDLLGRGGAGEVFRAVRQDGQPPPGEVALKLVRTERKTRLEAEQRLARETALLRRLSHPTIVQLLDSGQDGDTLYLVEELLEGGSLTSRIPAEGLKPEPFLELFLPILEAVAFAHEQGVMHRDLKPANVLFTAAGDLRVTDFGLARADESTVLTTNHCMGTPVYMAPELFSGRPATPATDQYALGVIAYEMLSGRPPFEGDSVMEIVAQHLQPTPPLTGVPEALAAVVMRMLEPAAEARWDSVRAVASALHGLQGRV